MKNRAARLLNTKDYNNPCLPMEVAKCDLDVPFGRQYVLRMLVHRPDIGWAVPAVMAWLQLPITLAVNNQVMNFGEDSVDKRFVYVTIRHGEVTSETDDVWHADGFSMRVPHVPEQNYIWCDHTSTEFYTGAVKVPQDFDPMVHNIHQLFQDLIPTTAEPYSTPAKTLVAFDTYHIHRRPKVPAGSHRTMVRISFVPIQIETDDCMQNPAFPVEVFNRSDIRTRLTRYEFSTRSFESEESPEQKTFRILKQMPFLEVRNIVNSYNKPLHWKEKLAEMGWTHHEYKAKLKEYHASLGLR